MLTLYRIRGPGRKSYIGITNRPLDIRLRAHVHGRRNYLGYALRKHGIEAFTIEPLVVGGDKYIQRLERVAIEVFKTRFPRGYNLSSGGEYPQFHSATKARIQRVQLEVQKRPDYMEEKRENTREQWKDPEVKRRMISGIQRAWQDPERRERHRAAMRKHWEKRKANNGN